MKDKDLIKIGILLLIFLTPLFLGLIYFFLEQPQTIYIDPSQTPPVTSTPPKPTITDVPTGFNHPPIISSPPLTSPQPPPKVDLYLSMPIPSYKICCGIIPSKITITGSPRLENKGTATAHNVKVVFELYLQDGRKINLDGKESITRFIGDIGPKKTVNQVVEFNINLIDGYSVQDDGAIALFKISSDEKSLEIREVFNVP